MVLVVVTKQIYRWLPAVQTSGSAIHPTDHHEGTKLFSLPIVPTHLRRTSSYGASLDLMDCIAQRPSLWRRRHGLHYSSTLYYINRSDPVQRDAHPPMPITQSLQQISNPNPSLSVAVISRKVL